MKNCILTLLVLTLLLPVYFSKQHRKKSFFHYWPHPFRWWRKLEDLDVAAGDVVICKFNTPFKSMLIVHWLLAISDDEFIHEIWNQRRQCGHIVQNNPYNMAFVFETKKCQNLGNGGYDPQESVARALEWNYKYVYFNKFHCSCQHWINYWVTGEPGGHSYTFPYLPADEKCLKKQAESDSSS